MLPRVHPTQSSGALCALPPGKHLLSRVLGFRILHKVGHEDKRNSGNETIRQRRAVWNNSNHLITPTLTEGRSESGLKCCPHSAGTSYDPISINNAQVLGKNPHSSFAQQKICFLKKQKLSVPPSVPVLAQARLGNLAHQNQLQASSIFNVFKNFSVGN